MGIYGNAEPVLSSAALSTYIQTFQETLLHLDVGILHRSNGPVRVLSGRQCVRSDAIGYTGHLSRLQGTTNRS